jgi:hypothetical protein
MELKVIDGFYIIDLPKAILVLTREQFIDGLRRGKWWMRRQAMAPREATMQQHAEQERERLPMRTQRN